MPIDPIVPPDPIGDLHSVDPSDIPHSSRSHISTSTPDISSFSSFTPIPLSFTDHIPPSFYVFLDLSMVLMRQTSVMIEQ